MAIVFISVWTLIARTVVASISIELEPPLIEFGKSGLDIRCVVNDTNLIGITNIQLKRSEISVVTVTKFKIAWQDKALENKTEVTVDGSINNTMTSYLRLEILKTAIRYPEDMGSYQCILIAVIASGEIERYHSQSIVLNITGFLESTTKLFSTSNHKSTEVSAQNGYQEKQHRIIYQYRQETSCSLQNNNDSYNNNYIRYACFYYCSRASITLFCIKSYNNS